MLSLDNYDSSLIFLIFRSVHHGGSGQQLHVQPWRGGDDYPGPDAQPQHSEAQQNAAAVRGLRRDGHQLRLLLGVHEDEAPRLHAVLKL